MPIPYRNAIVGLFALSLSTLTGCKGAKAPTGDGEDGPAPPPGVGVAVDVDAATCNTLAPARQVVGFEGPVAPGSTIPVGQALDPIRGIHYQGVLCVDVDRSAPLQTVGDDWTLSVAFARDAGELAKALGVDVDAAFGIGLWQEHAAARFLHEYKFETTSVFAVLRSSVRTREQGGARPVQLQEFARRLLDEGAYGKFIRRCGTAFVTRVHKGGDFFVVVEFTSTTASERQLIEQTLGTATPQPGAADEEGIKKLEGLIAAHPHKLGVIRPGGAGNTGSLSFASLVKLARELPAAVARAPRQIGFTAVPYSTIHQFQSAPLDHYNAVEAMLMDLGAVYSDARANLNTLATYTRLLSSSGPGWGKYDKANEEACKAVAVTFGQTRDAYNQHVGRLEQAARTCINERPASSCFVSNSCVVPAEQPPALPDVPTTCQRSCEFNLIDLFASSGLQRDAATVRLKCDGLIPGSRYKVEVSGGRLGTIRDCVNKDGRDVGIQVTGGLGVDAKETYKAGAAESAMNFSPKPLSIEVPSDGLLDVPLSLRNENGDKGCVYSVTGKAKIVPE
ncbi:MAG: hypothetical protein KC636_28890 [Myxococcales bacterium]|nr:hypothetical protein [Myxococcales bacterium]